MKPLVADDDARVGFLSVQDAPEKDRKDFGIREQLPNIRVDFKNSQKAYFTNVEKKLDSELKELDRELATYVPIG